ncbi:MAG: HD-GYP domain-containing protein [Planctomycetaceae bacterium]
MIQAVSHPDTVETTPSANHSDVEYWYFQSGWQREDAFRGDQSHLKRAQCGTESSRQNAATIANLIELAFARRTPVVELLSDHLAAIVTPYANRNPRMATVRYVPVDTSRLLNLLCDATAQMQSCEMLIERQTSTINSQNDQLAAYAAQVSDDLEELIWLRRLACNLELSESGNSTEHIADTVLPSLCDLISAQMLTFVRDIPLDADDDDLPVVWQTGDYRASKETILQLMNELARSETDQPVVMNNWCSGYDLESARSGRGCPVDSCIMVPVATSTARLGWLIAFNKDSNLTSRYPRFSGPEYTTYLSENEFGTFEASLMNATAVVLAAHGRNCSLFREKELLLRGVIRSMINAIDAKDSYTCGHSDRVAEFARMIASELELPAEQCEEIYMTGLLHDVGKIGVPDNVLKKPGRLTSAEFELIKQHPVIGYEILKHLRHLDYVLPGVLHHHESWDGSGYPYGLTGNNIPLEARILAVADAYDAMTSNRPYRRGMPTAKAEQILRDGAGQQWDARCVEAFFRVITDARRISGRNTAPFVPVIASAVTADY